MFVSLTGSGFDNARNNISSTNSGARKPACSTPQDTKDVLKRGTWYLVLCNNSSAPEYFTDGPEYSLADGSWIYSMRGIKNHSYDWINVPYLFLVSYDAHCSEQTRGVQASLYQKPKRTWAQRHKTTRMRFHLVMACKCSGDCSGSSEPVKSWRIAKVTHQNTQPRGEVQGRRRPIFVPHVTKHAREEWLKGEGVMFVMTKGAVGGERNLHRQKGTRPYRPPRRPPRFWVTFPSYNQITSQKSAVQLHLFLWLFFPFSHPVSHSVLLSFLPFLSLLAFWSQDGKN